jgi:formylglycine-generating enzyme required for sulfatase activity
MRRRTKIIIVISISTAVLILLAVSFAAWKEDASSTRSGRFSHYDRGKRAITRLAAGWSHSLALKPDGSIVGLGDNRWGMADPPDGNDFVAIAAGTYYSLALKSDGSIVGWGDGASGARYPPDGNDFAAISAGSSHALALKRDGSIVGWGDNDWGQARPPPGNNFVAIAAGFSHSLALKSNGSIVGWGHNEFGKADPPDSNDFVAIAAGGSYSLALNSDGSIVGWGWGSDGEANLPDGNDFIAIAAGFSHGLALKTNGSIVGWGSNDGGQARPPTGNDFVAIAAGVRHSLALKSDGSIVGWGEKLAMEKPILPKPETKEKARKEPKVEVTDVVEVQNVSSLKSIKPPPKAIRLTVDDKMKVDLIYIKPDSFTMGRNVGWGEKFFSKISSMGMVGKYPDDWPARKVKITKGFYIGKYKVTSAQFCKFLSTVDNPQDYVKLNIFAHIEIKDGAYVPKAGCENCAINVVHWKGAKAFCEWLSHQTGLTVRLPTEAEWEFAARGPEGRHYPWGDDEDVHYAESPSREYKKYPHPWSCAPIDAFPENVTPDGVVGMAGLIGEWCSDFYGVRYLKKDVIDPKGPTEKDLSDKSLNPFGEKYYVFRGYGLNATNRSIGDIVDGSGIYGFRILMEAVQGQSE